MFACSICKKSLSSRQALQYHMKSSKCTQRSPFRDKMRREADITIECTLDGFIKDYMKQGTPIRSSSIIGKSLYDMLHESSRYEMSLKHIHALTHNDAVSRIESIIIDGVLCSEIKKFSCIICAHDNVLSVYLSETL